MLGKLVVLVALDSDGAKRLGGRMSSADDDILVDAAWLNWNGRCSGITIWLSQSH